jgi:hypothetical protein
VEGEEDIMRVSKRDVLATVLVAVASVLYIMWVAGSAAFGMDSARATGVAILVLGFVASAIAVVPSFTGLLHGNRTYLVVASLLGVVATGAGVQMLVASSGAGLTVVVVAMVILWLTATVHHTLLANAQNVDGRSAVAPRRGEPTRTYAH